MNPEQPQEKGKVARLSEEDLRAFVDDYVSGRVFTSLELQGENVGMDELASRIRMVFMPIAFGALKGFDDEELGNVSIFYEHIREAMPRGVNGWPTFMSVRIMHKDDWARVCPVIQAEFARRRDITIPPVSS